MHKDFIKIAQALAETKVFAPENRDEFFPFLLPPMGVFFYRKMNDVPCGRNIKPAGGV